MKGKRLWVILLVLVVLVASFTACGKKDKDANKNKIGRAHV